MPKKIIAIDFDGVLYSFENGWLGTTELPDPPVGGAIAWLCSLYFSNAYEPVIFSCRCKAWRGRRAIRKWLVRYGFPKEHIKQLKLTSQKPAAHLILDDRAVPFCKVFPVLSFIDSFIPWHSREVWGE